MEYKEAIREVVSRSLRAMGTDYDVDIDEVIDVFRNMNKENVQFIKDNNRAKEIIQKLNDTVKAGSGFCPLCHKVIRNGHAERCELSELNEE